MSSTLETRETEEMTFSNLMKLVYSFGIPAAIAVFLVYTLKVEIAQGVSEIRAGLLIHATQSVEAVKASETLQNRVDDMTQILQSICVNTAETQIERNACFTHNRQRTA